MLPPYSLYSLNVKFIKYLYLLIMKERMQNETQFFRIPFQLNNAQIKLLSQLDEWWFDQDQSRSLQILSQPLNQSSTLAVICYLIQKVCTAKKQINIVYLADLKSRGDFLLDLAKTSIKKFYYQSDSQLPILSNEYIPGRQNSQIVISTFKQFVKFDLPEQHIYHHMVIETSNFARVIADAFGDYITDTYLRRGYIEALRLQERYRQSQKNSNIRNSHSNLFKKIQNDYLNLELHSFGSKSTEKKEKNNEQRKESTENKRIRRAYQNKKQELRRKKMRNQNNKWCFEQNQLILLSSIMYLLGFFSKLMQSKKTRSIDQFIEEYKTKTSLTTAFFERVLEYYKQVFNNCPHKISKNIEETYLYSFCQFVHKIILYSKVFPDTYIDLFEIRVQSFPLQKRESLIEQSTSCITINCKQNHKIYPKLIKQKSLNCVVIQNLACPEQYWRYLLKTKNLLVQNSATNNKFSRIYGLNISKTDSNEDLNFSQKLKPDIETIKIKACGVLLHDLSKFIPDGIVVYFHSLEGLESFIKEMEKEDERILKRIDNNKKIFFQSVLEEQNNINYTKFKKCCQIGRGGMFLMAANGKASQNLKFYHHLSRCIVFFGLPKKEREQRKENDIKKQPDVKVEFQPKLDGEFQRESQQDYANNLQKILIFNQCINNCLNDIDDCKSIIFVGRQITNDLQNWYKSFIKSWDETTRESLMKLRYHFQKMGTTNFTK